MPVDRPDTLGMPMRKPKQRSGRMRPPSPSGSGEFVRVEETVEAAEVKDSGESARDGTLDLWCPFDLMEGSVSVVGV